MSSDPAPGRISESSFITSSVSALDSTEMLRVSTRSKRTLRVPVTLVAHLLDQLRQAPKVAQNLCHNGKRNKAACCMRELKNISASQHVKEYSGECFVVSSDKLFCDV